MFTRRKDAIRYEYACKMFEVPVAEAPVCLSGVPVLLLGRKFMSILDTRVITPHLVIQPCNEIYQTMIKSIGSGWITVSTRSLQVKTPDPRQISSSYKAPETLTTLYTQEKFHKWEQFLQLYTYEKSQHQRLLNVLCKEDSCSYGGHSALAGMNMDEFKKHIYEVIRCSCTVLQLHWEPS